MFLKTSPVALLSCNTVGLSLQFKNKRARLFDSTHLSSQKKTSTNKTVAYITHNATETLSGIPGVYLSDNTQLRLEPQKAGTLLFLHMQQCSPIPVNTL